MLNLCELQKRTDLHFRYETGNIETLKRMVDQSDGITILPELAVRELSKHDMQFVKRMQEPVPVREVSMVTHRDHIKTRLIRTLMEEIAAIVPAGMRQMENKKVVEVSY